MRQSARTAAHAGRKDRRRPMGDSQARIDALEAELAEARAEQTAAAEVLDVINSVDRHGIRALTHFRCRFGFMPVR